MAAHTLCRAAVLAATVIALAAGTTARAADPRFPELEYAYPDQSVWTTRIDQRGEPDNPLLRLAAALFDKAGIPWHGRSYPAARVFTNLRDGTAQFSMLVASPGLEECCLIGRAPVASTELRVYRAAATPPIRDAAGLAGKRVVTIRGYSYGGLLDFLSDARNGAVNNATVGHQAAFAMLDAGRGDYLLDYTGPAVEVLTGHPIGGLRFDVLSRLDVHLVLSRSYPEAAAVMARLEAIAATLDTGAILAADGK